MNEKCEHFFYLLNDYIDGNLNIEEQEKVNKHLSNCKNCMEEFKELHLTINTIKSLNNIEIPAANEAFASNIITKLNQERFLSQRLKFNIPKYAAASILIIAITAFIAINTVNKYNNTVVVNNSNNITSEYTDDFDALMSQKDTSIIAEAGLPTDQWGLLDLGDL